MLSESIQMPFAFAEFAQDSERDFRILLDARQDRADPRLCAKSAQISAPPKASGTSGIRRNSTFLGIEWRRV